MRRWQSIKRQAAFFEFLAAAARAWIVTAELLRLHWHGRILGLFKIGDIFRLVRFEADNVLPASQRTFLCNVLAAFLCFHSNNDRVGFGSEFGQGIFPADRCWRIRTPIRGSVDKLCT